MRRAGGNGEQGTVGSHRGRHEEGPGENLAVRCCRGARIPNLPQVPPGLLHSFSSLFSFQEQFSKGSTQMPPPRGCVEIINGTKGKETSEVTFYPELDIMTLSLFGNRDRRKPICFLTNPVLK